MNRQNALLVALPLMLVFAYWYFFTGPSSTTPLSVSTTSSPAGQQFIELSGKLNALNFNTAIFQDPRFTALVSLETPITPENKGRVDPFAPLGR